MALVIKSYWWVLAVAAVCLWVWVAAALHARTNKPVTPMTPEHSATSTTLTIGSTTIVAEVADTDALRERGLGGRTSLAQGQGMWFVFGTDDYWPFWMKDTLIPLDILWVSKEGTIVTIAHDVDPKNFPEVYKPTKPARYVLELPGGYTIAHGIAEGQVVKF